MAWLFDNPLALWLAIGGVLLAIEVAMGSGWLLWPAGSAAATAVLAPLFPNMPLQSALFAVLTIATTLAGRHFFPRNVKGGDINDTMARLAGSAGVVTHGFQAGSGRVMVDGKEWAAHLEGGGVLSPGASVTVTSVGGAHLTVRAS